MPENVESDLKCSPLMELGFLIEKPVGVHSVKYCYVSVTVNIFPVEVRHVVGRNTRW